MVVKGKQRKCKIKLMQYRGFNKKYKMQKLIQYVNCLHASAMFGDAYFNRN